MQFNLKKELLRFLAEDIKSGDITSALLPKKYVKARIISRQNGVAAGVKFAKELFGLKNCKVVIKIKDGQKLKKNQTLMEITGTVQNILSCERTALNLLSRMSGIATQTSALTKELPKKTRLFATRKTAPGLRVFDKEAVKIGGGQKHRMGLDEAVMFKDNHLSVGLSVEELIKRAKKRYGTVEVEVETKNDAVIAAQKGATIIMLDNFTPRQIKSTIKELQRYNMRKKVKLEASGGITEKNIKEYAKTGVDMISVGKITNSVDAIDLSLEIVVDG